MTFYAELEQWEFYSVSMLNYCANNNIIINRTLKRCHPRFDWILESFSKLIVHNTCYFITRILINKASAWSMHKYCFWTFSQISEASIFCQHAWIAVFQKIKQKKNHLRRWFTLPCYLHGQNSVLSVENYVFKKTTINFKLSINQ